MSVQHCLVSSSLLAQPDFGRTLSARDTLRIDAVGSPTLSPDGEWVLYTRSSYGLDQDIDVDQEMERRTQIWRSWAAGGEHRQMTRGQTDSTSPAWLPDGERFAFLASRGKGRSGDSGNGGGGNGDDGPKRQVYFMHLDGGEAWAVTDHDEGVQQFRLSPDGSKIAFLARDPLSEEEKKKQKLKDDTVVVDDKFRWVHLWVWDVEAEEATRLTEGAFTVSDPRWSPDGEQLAYVTRPTTKNDDGWNSDVWVISAGGGEPRTLYENAGTDSAPRWSPDGKFVAFASKPHVKTNTYYSKLVLVPADGKGPEPRTLLGDFDRDFSAPIWSYDGARIYRSTGDRTSSRLFAVEVPTGEVEPLATPEGGNFSFELSRDGSQWTFVHSASNWPPEIYIADLDLGNSRRVSDANGWLRDESVEVAQARTVAWRNSDGQEIEGVLTLPVGYREGERYPFVLNPHGGPSGAVTESWSSTTQFLAGNGFMVLQPNFRGSSNYGQEFLNANRNYWGVRDYDDCMTGVDYAIDQGWADPERLIAYGWSYGGYMSFWISTQTDRFKVVSRAPGCPTSIRCTARPTSRTTWAGSSARRGTTRTSIAGCRRSATPRTSRTRS